ncbi:MAG TPA: hypothetical protein VJB94_00430 [Candidatus Nanoarchaeia archaeon]|nr:hypothetical protein [Candidatus Nanoarchaeia archaeon]
MNKKGFYLAPLAMALIVGFLIFVFIMSTTTLREGFFQALKIIFG